MSGPVREGRTGRLYVWWCGVSFRLMVWNISRVPERFRFVLYFLLQPKTAIRNSRLRDFLHQIGVWKYPDWV